MRRRAWFAAVIAFTVIFGLVAVWARAQGEKEESPATSPFHGKILVVSLGSTPYGSVLGDVEIRKIGNQTFLFGKGLDSGHPRDWCKGRSIWVAIDKISMMAEFPDLETYHETTEGQ